MNRRFTTHLTALAVAALVLFGAGQALAATAATTVVTNTATITFTANGAAGLSSDGSASFTVDHMIDPVVVRDTAGNPTVFSGATSGQQVEIQYTVSNAGNSTQTFKLELINKLAGDSFDVTLVGNIDDTSGAGGTDKTLVTLAAGADQTVYMTVQVPAGKADTETAVFWLQAAAWDTTASGYLAETGPSADLSVADIVFADANGQGDGDGQYDGKHTGSTVDDTCTVTVGNPVLTVAKGSGVLSDPFGSATPYRVPGAVLQYTITITNATGGTVTLTDFADAIPAELELLQNIDAAGGTSGTDAVLIDTTGTVRPSASATAYPTGANVTVAAGAGGDLAIVLSNILGAEAGYAAGELKNGEFIEIKYNATIQ